MINKSPWEFFVGMWAVASACKIKVAMLLATVVV